MTRTRINDAGRIVESLLFGADASESYIERTIAKFTQDELVEFVRVLGMLANGLVGKLGLEAMDQLTLTSVPVEVNAPTSEVDN